MPLRGNRERRNLEAGNIGRLAQQKSLLNAQPHLHVARTHLLQFRADGALAHDELVFQPVGGLQLGGPRDHPPLQLGIERADFRFGPLAGPGLRGLFDDPFHGGGQPRQAVFEDVIVRAGLDHAHRRFVPQDPGDHDDRQVRILFPGQLDRRKTVEIRKRIIGQHHIRMELLERLHERVPGGDTSDNERESGVAQLPLYQLRVGRHVLQVQDSKIFLRFHQYLLRAHDGSLLITIQYMPRFAIMFMNWSNSTGLAI